jgi:hypothetical protein
VVGALVAGTYTAEATVDPIEVDDPCPNCGERPLVVTYEDDHVHVTCSGCETFRNHFSFPPGVVEQYDREELPEAFDRWLRTLFERITAGFCANCAGRLDGALVTDEERPRFEWSCERCGDLAASAVSTPLLYHPATQGFLFDHGVDPSSAPSWRLARTRDIETSVTDDGVTVRIAVDGDTLTGHLDTTGSVTRVDRSDR